MTKVGVYGWGVVAPRSPDIESFARNLESSESWLSPFDGFGPTNFLVGNPEFDFEVYREWIEARFPPSRFAQLTSKMDLNTLFAVGAFIQSLDQNPGIEEVLQELGPQAHVYIGVGLGALPTQQNAIRGLERAQRAWDRYWAAPERCPPHARYREDPEGVRGELGDVPVDPETIDDPEDRDEARREWNRYWTARSPDLRKYLAELGEIEELGVGGAVESSKLNVIREKERRRGRLQEKWGAPDPPWSQVTTNFLWNIGNTPASQVSMLGRITGFTFAPLGACATFGVCLKLAMDAIRRGEARAVVIGATDPPPHPLTVGAFYRARVLASGADVSKPLTGLRGTHVSGGSVIWIVGDREFMEEKGFQPLGMEPVGVGVSSDADHIITPSKDGPLQAIRSAFDESGIEPDEVGSWDLHATATPGDYLEVENMREILPEHVLITARKGTFGHGMSAGGGWELTAQYLGMERGILFPTPLLKSELNSEISRVHDAFVYDTACELGGRPVGKLSMGVGGVNSCVVSRPLTSSSS